MKGGSCVFVPRRGMEDTSVLSLSAAMHVTRRLKFGGRGLAPTMPRVLMFYLLDVSAHVETYIKKG